MHAGDIEMRRDAGAHQVGQHDDLAGVLGVGVGIDQRREFVERIAPERCRADVLEKALAMGSSPEWQWMLTRPGIAMRRRPSISMSAAPCKPGPTCKKPLAEGNVDALPIGMRVVVLARE